MEVVLVEPEIPQNTGAIARTCAATRTPLHLVGRLGFDISEKSVRRAGLDYWPLVTLQQHADWEAYSRACAPKRVWLFTKYAARSLYEAQFEPTDTLVFGNETRGLGFEFLRRFSSEQGLLIPMPCQEVRSLNLSNAVAIALYEALRQTGSF